MQELFTCDLGQLSAPIAHIDAPESGHAVEYLVAVGIMDVAPVGTRDDAAAAQRLHQPVVLLCRQVVREVQFAQTRRARRNNQAT